MSPFVSVRTVRGSRLIPLVHRAMRQKISIAICASSSLSCSAGAGRLLDHTRRKQGVLVRGNTALVRMGNVRGGSLTVSGRALVRNSFG